ncbi:MAG: hypothetical protein V4684_20740 [Pseudomonadota bacterium]
MPVNESASPEPATAGVSEASRSRIPVFVGGALAGAALAGAMAFAFISDRRDAEPAPVAAVQKVTDPACRIDPIVKAAEAGDGSAVYASTGSGSALIVKGKEAAAAGRDRDAEVAFLTACKLEPAQPDDAATLARADAKYNLGRHYASLAQEGAGNRAELSSRAAILLKQSLAVYQAQLGAGHEKARFATQAIAVLENGKAGPAQGSEQVAAVSRPATAPQAPPAPAKTPSASNTAAASKGATPSTAGSPATPQARPAPAAKPARKASEADRTAVAAAPAKPAPSAQRAAAATGIRPSFDCSRARSVPEKIICSDPQLARMDRDLGRLYARAKRDADDPRAFQRVSDREWRRRESECRDRECLVDWYLDRREQLLVQVGDDEDE